MLKLDNLPVDIIYEISKHLYITDICILEKTCKNLYRNIRGLHNIILTNILKDEFNFRKDKSTLKSFFYNSLHNYLSYQIFNDYFYDKNNWLMYSTGYIDENVTRKGFNITQNWFINRLFLKIFYSFAYDHYHNITNYNNKLELYAFYMFLQIEVYQNKRNFSKVHRFLESINRDVYYNIRIRYYTSILDSFHDDIFRFTFDQMVSVSSTIISIPMFKKIMGYKVLDLSKTIFHQCCLDCNEENLIEICEFKVAHFRDDLVSHNYIQFKKLLYSQSSYYYSFLTNRETFLVNNYIYIKNPRSNRRMRLNGYVYREFLRSLNSDPLMNNCYTRILKNVSRRKEYLRLKFFT